MDLQADLGIGIVKEEDRVSEDGVSTSIQKLRSSKSSQEVGNQ